MEHINKYLDTLINESTDLKTTLLKIRLFTYHFNIFQYKLDNDINIFDELKSDDLFLACLDKQSLLEIKNEIMDNINIQNKLMINDIDKNIFHHLFKKYQKEDKSVVSYINNNLYIIHNNLFIKTKGSDFKSIENEYSIYDLSKFDFNKKYYDNISLNKFNNQIAFLKEYKLISDIKEVAKNINISLHTIYKWLEEPHFIIGFEKIKNNHIYKNELLSLI